MDFVVMAGIVVGMTECIKIGSGLNARYIPICSVVVAIVFMGLAALLNDFPLTWELVQNSIVVGLTASGLYSGGKATIGK